MAVRLFRIIIDPSYVIEFWIVCLNQGVIESRRLRFRFQHALGNIDCRESTFYIWIVDLRNFLRYSWWNRRVVVLVILNLNFETLTNTFTALTLCLNPWLSYNFLNFVLGRQPTLLSTTTGDPSHRHDFNLFKNSFLCLRARFRS